MSKCILGTAVAAAVALAIAPVQAKELGAVTAPQQTNTLAKSLLEKEGFKYGGTIDVFDAGPVMECRR